jgi:hypothetical protein
MRLHRESLRRFREPQRKLLKYSAAGVPKALFFNSVALCVTSFLKVKTENRLHISIIIKQNYQLTKSQLTKSQIKPLTSHRFFYPFSNMVFDLKS